MKLRKINILELIISTATYDLNTIHSIVNTSHVLHVSFNPEPPADPFPATLPLIGQMGSFEYPSAGLDEPLDCYLHGYVSSRIVNMARNSSAGLPVCIAATKVDGLVLTLTPNTHNYNFRSAILHGYATLVTDVEEKLWAMELITNSVVPDRWKNTRIPPDQAEMSSTAILKVRIADGSGKIRGGNKSADPKDIGNTELTDRVWTGVIPVWECFGEPVPSSENKVSPVPQYIDTFVTRSTERNRSLSENSALERP